MHIYNTEHCCMLVEIVTF